ncbi:uncharacterized protein SPSC_02169 [Sporisorium scitamineum]|uniref:JmjC domain-containing protein n=1 Tax=Sporisorium scitamineum TaxID=49012 RepID=A0A0F7S7R5_9BASI|nr:uncharacterized protein SPSC_02169 [Sporisorium scitamineum]CDW96763.1 hypothetical protein [Sporisorium scitamineum]
MTKSEQTRHGDAELTKAILAQLSQSLDASSIEPTDAAALAAQRKIRKVVRCLLSSSQAAQSRSEQLNAHLSSLARLCDQKFVTFSYDGIPSAWRAIYIDAQLIKACCTLKAVGDSEQSAKLVRCIRDLDMALIVAGAASTPKGQHCHDLIACLQSNLLEREQRDAHHSDRSCFGHRSPPRKRSRLAQPEPYSPQLSESIQADSLIREYPFEEAPSFMDLAAPDSSSRSRPFIVRAYAQKSGWPAVQSNANEGVPGSWSSTEHLLRTAGPARVVPVEVGANYTRKDWGQDVMLWSDFLRYCRWDEDGQHGGAIDGQNRQEAGSARPVLYMAQHDLAAQFPALESDYMLPDYVYTSPPPPASWPGYRPPVTPDGVITNLWIGPAGTVSPPHRDPFYNCFVQVVGYKEVWVAPPHCCPRKIAAPSGHTPAKDAVNLSSADTGSITDSLMANTASIDVFDAIEDVPLVRSAAAKAVLGPGDLLYMPPGWWHSLRSLTRSFSVSTWF